MATNLRPFLSRTQNRVATLASSVTAILVDDSLLFGAVANGFYPFMVSRSAAFARPTNNAVAVGCVLFFFKLIITVEGCGFYINGL